MISLQEYQARTGGFYSRALSLSNERGAKWKKRRKKNNKAGKSEDREDEIVENTLEDARKPMLTVRGLLMFTLLVMFGVGIVASGGLDERMDQLTSRILLLRGGIERNPGPVMKSVSGDEQDAVIAKLISTTDSENIRRMLAPLESGESECDNDGAEEAYCNSTGSTRGTCT